MRALASTSVSNSNVLADEGAPCEPCADRGNDPYCITVEAVGMDAFHTDVELRRWECPLAGDLWAWDYDYERIVATSEGSWIVSAYDFAGAQMWSTSLAKHDFEVDMLILTDDFIDNRVARVVNAREEPPDYCDLAIESGAVQCWTPGDWNFTLSWGGCDTTGSAAGGLGVWLLAWLALALRRRETSPPTRPCRRPAPPVHHP